MKKRLALLAVLLAASLMTVQCGRRTEEEGALRIGAAAPGFELYDLRGQKVSLSEFRGKVVILDFWATWCGPCRLSMPMLEKLQLEHPNDLKLLAINLEEPRDEVRDYVMRQHVRSTVLLDSDGQVGQVYGSDQIPMQVLIDKQGVVRDVKIGYSPRLAEQFRRQLDQLNAD